MESNEKLARYAADTAASVSKAASEESDSHFAALVIITDGQTVYASSRGFPGRERVIELLKALVAGAVAIPDRDESSLAPHQVH